MANDGLRSRRVMAGGVNTHYTEAGETARSSSRLHGGGAGSSGESGHGPGHAAACPRFSRHRARLHRRFGDTDPHAPAPYGLINRATQLEAFADTHCASTNSR